MEQKKKAFKILYHLIANQQITHKEAYYLADAIFDVEYYPIAVPAVNEEAENPRDKTPHTVEGAGFRLPE